MRRDIKYINIAVTNRCNLRCKYCDIWKSGKKTDIDTGLIRKILESGVLSDTLNITLTGGEPFLHPDLGVLAEAIMRENKNALKTISTNGTLFDLINRFLIRFGKKLPRGFALNISFDGVNTPLLRGQASESVVENMLILHRLFPKVELRIKFTITPVNYKELLPTYLQAKQHNFAFKMKLVEHTSMYTNQVSPKKIVFDTVEKRAISKDLLLVKADFEKTDCSFSRFIDKTLAVLWGNKIHTKCLTPDNRIFIMPDGAIYSCLHAISIGNLKHSSLKQVWFSKEAQNIRKNIKQLGCQGCAAYHGYP